MVEEKRPESIKNLIEVTSTNLQESSILNTKEMQQDQRLVEVVRSMRKLGAEYIAGISNTTHKKTKSKPGSRIPVRKTCLENYQCLQKHFYQCLQKTFLC